MTQQTILNEFDRIITDNEIDSVLPFLAQYKKGNVGVLKKQLKQWHEKITIDKEFTFLDELNKDAFALFAFGLLSVSDITHSWLSLRRYLYSKSLHYLSDNKQSESYQQDKKIGEIILQFDIDVILQALKVKHRGETYINYTEVRFLGDNGIYDYDAELFAKLAVWFYLHNIVFTSSIYDKQAVYKKACHYLDTDPNFVRDIKQSFVVETNITTFQTRRIHNTIKPKLIEQTLIDVIKYMVDSKKVDKEWLIERCFAISHNNSGWESKNRYFYFNLILSLIDNDDELLPYQSQLFANLSSDTHKIVQLALKIIKKINHKKDFHVEEFFQQLTIVIANNHSKTLLNAVISNVEQLVKKQANYRHQAVNLLIPIYVNQDNSLQEKLTKFLQANISEQQSSNQQNEAIALLQEYQSYLNADSKKALAEFTRANVISPKRH